MKTVAVIAIVTFMLADTFFLWCLLRANALYEQNENRAITEKDKSDEGKENPIEQKKENL